MIGNGWRHSTTSHVDSDIQVGARLKVYRIKTESVQYITGQHLSVSITWISPPP